MPTDITTALYRFSLGLPARAEDVEAVRAALPEVLGLTWPTAHDNDDRLAFPLVLPHAVVIAPRAGWASALRDWLSKGEQFGESAPSGGPSSCPLCIADCPLYRPSASSGASPPSDASAEPTHEIADESDQIFRFLAVGGGPAGAAKRRFIDLLRKTTKGCHGGDIRQVIITDPYLHSSFDEDGADGKGFGAFIEVLKEALELAPHHTFDMFLNPRLGPAVGLLGNQLLPHFPHATVKQFRVGAGRIHDRFYLVRGTGDLHGVFGPSMNGLSGAGVFLMGDLDSAALAKLDKIIHRS